MVDVPVVSVRGEIVREVPPELARFSVRVSARTRDRQTTISRLTGRAEAIRALLDSFGAVVERRETSGLYVAPERRGSGEKVTGYRGSVSTTVTVSDFTVLGELMLRLADEDQTDVFGPWWELRPDSPTHRDARREAVAEAVRRAGEYAEAVGSRLVRLLEIADVGMSAGQPAPRMMRFASAGGPELTRTGGVPELDLDPVAQRVHAAVEARFTITEPPSTWAPGA